ncbi:MAG: hypothetical protein GY696_06250 [Gammaproteobacteria bacterium]|nr:hypothetical protein [Gammaproteobacteria bacterium]
MTRYIPDNLTNNSTYDEAEELLLQDEVGPLLVDPSSRGWPVLTNPK